MTQKQNAIVLACDKAYLPPALFVANQLLRQSKQPYDIVILRTDTVVLDEAAPLAGVTMLPIRAQIEAVMPSSLKVPSMAMFARLLVHRLIADTYRTILYLDSDIWIGRDNIHTLFELDLAGYPVAAVRDNFDVFGRQNEYFIRHKREIGMDAEAPYLNSGVLLIDRERWVAEHIGDKAIRYILDGNNIDHHDQTALNATLNGRWLELSPCWNWTHATTIRITEEATPSIVHFIGSSKPWNDKRARYPIFYGLEMRAFYEQCGCIGFYHPPPRFSSVRRHASRVLRQLRGLVYDRRANAIRTHLVQTQSQSPERTHL